MAEKNVSGTPVPMKNRFAEYDQPTNRFAEFDNPSPGNRFAEYDETPEQVNERINQQMAERQEKADRGFLENSARSLGAGATKFAGGLVKAVGAIESVRPAGHIPAMNPIHQMQIQEMDERGLNPLAFEREMSPEEFSAYKDKAYQDTVKAAEAVESVDFGYDPDRNSVEKTKDLWKKGNWLGAALSAPPMLTDQLIQSVPYMVNAPLTALSIGGKVTHERVENTEGKDRPAGGDVAIGAVAGTASGMLERILPRALFRQGKEITEAEAKAVAEGAKRYVLGKIGKEAAKDMGIEGLTEAVQEGVIEYVGSRYGTDAAMSVQEAAMTGMEAGLIGAGIGGGLGAGRGAYDGAREARAARLQQRATPEAVEAELEGDVDVDAELAELMGDLDDIGPDADRPAPEAAESSILNTDNPDLTDYDVGLAPVENPVPGEMVYWAPQGGTQSLARFEGIAGEMGGQQIAKVVVDGREELVPVQDLFTGEYQQTPETGFGGPAQATLPDDAIPYEPPAMPERDSGLSLQQPGQETAGGIDYVPPERPGVDEKAQPVVDAANEYLRQQEQDATRQALESETAVPVRPEIDPAEQAELYPPDPSAPRVGPAAERVDATGDARLSRPEFRDRLSTIASELEKGGGVSYIRDENDRITGRTPSVNPDWFKAMNENPETKMSVEDTRAAIDKALRGEKLGVRQLRVVGAALDSITEERGSYAREIRVMRENAREDRRRAYEQWREATNVPMDAEFEATVWPESPGEVYNETDYLPDYTMPERATMELVEAADALGVPWDQIDKALAEPDGDAQTKALTQLVWDAQNEHRIERGDSQATSPESGSAENEGSPRPLEETPSDQARRDQADSPPAELTLSTQTEQELADRARVLQDAERAEAETRQREDRRAAADRERDDFVLSGSNTEADQAAARGQGDLLSPTTRVKAEETAPRQLQQHIKANTEANPTEAQKEAGNYRKASINVQGLDISIENPRGGKRSGVDPDGNAWEVTMHNHYGYIRRSEGADGEHVDVFVGPNPASDKVFIVDQVNPDGSFDEHKVLLGFDSKLKARSGYKSNYSKGWKVGPITSMNMDEFKAWLKDGDTKKPLKPDAFAGKVPESKPDQETQSVSNPDEFVKAPNGSTDFGEINADVAKAIGRQSGRVRLQEGEHRGNHKGFGRAHIAAEHPEIGDPVQFVEGVASGFDRIHRSRLGRLKLVKDGSPNELLVVELKPHGDGDFYSVLSAYKTRKENSELLWSAPHSRSADPGGQPALSEDEALGDAGEPISSVKQTAANSSIAQKSTSRQAAPIEDAGEKLGGARKDELRTVRERLENMDDEAIASSTLGKMFPKPEIDKVGDKKAAAIYQVARDLIPAKPRKSYRLKRWVDTVRQARELIGLVEEVGPDALLERIEKAGIPKARDIVRRVEVLNGIDRGQWGRVGVVTQASGQYSKGDEMVSGAWVTVEIDGRLVAFYGHDTIQSALPEIRQRLDDKGPAGKKLKFAVYQDLRAGEYFIAQDSDKEKRRLKTFDSPNDARAYIRDNHDDLVAAWDAVKNRDNVTRADMRRSVNAERTGTDYRDGKDVTPEQFLDAFGFRGVEFGNWVRQGKGAKERQSLLNDAYDAFMDLAEVLNIPPKALSLEGRLGIGMGSRGRGGKNAAHFEPGSIVINLTKTKGAGSLAHEWFHALDNYFARKRGEPVYRGDDDTYRREAFVTYLPEPMMVRKDTVGTAYPLRMPRGMLEWRRERSSSADFAEDRWIPDPDHKQGIRPEVERSFAELVKTLDESPMSGRAKVIDKGKVDGYWSQIIERAARSFENYVILRLADRGHRNDFLANVVSTDEFERNPERYPYLRDDEVTPVAQAFDNLFETLETRETESGVVLFSEQNSAGRPISKEAATRIIERIQANTPSVRIHLVDSFDSMPDEIVGLSNRQSVDGSRVRGVYHRGEIWLNRQALNSEAAVEQTIFHELYGHHGLGLIFGRATRQAMGKLYLRLGGIQGVRKLAEKHDVNLERYIQRHAKAVKSGGLTREAAQSILAEELLAHIAQDSRPSIKRAFQEFIGALRAKLREMGFLQLSEVSTSEIMHLLRQARQAVNEGRVTGSGGLIFDLLPSDNLEAMPAFSLMPNRTRKIIGDDPVLAGWTMLAQNDEVFQLPTSDKKLLTAIFKDLEGDQGMQIERADELAMQMEKYGATASWRITTPNGEKAAVYQKGKSVWIDVSALKQGENGKRIYNAVANYAHNTGRVFIGDPDGLSPTALTRRLENMISSALKFGTTRHLWPHDRQIEGSPARDAGDDNIIAGITWKDGDDAHNLRQMIMASYEATASQFPKIRDLRYNPKTDRFEDTSNDSREFKRSDFRELAKAARRVPDAGAGRASPTAGSTSLERAVLTNTLSRGTRQEVANILAKFGRLGSERLTGENAILYSQQADSEPRPSAGVSRSGVPQTETAAFKRWFGDSKVVDENGDPLVVYHGSDNSFSAFEMGRQTQRYVAMAQLERQSQGAFFSPIKDDAESYGGDVRAFYLSVERPLENPNQIADGERSAQLKSDIEYIFGPAIDESGYIDTDGGVSRIPVDAKGLWIDEVMPEGMVDWYLLDNPEVVARLKERGYDGAKVYEPNDESGYSWFVTEPTKIKSATDNTGTFDPDNADIRFSIADDSPLFAAPKEAKLYGIPKDWILRKVTDKMRPLLQTQREIEKAQGSPLDEALDAYRMEEAFHGKTENDIRKLRERFIEPLTKKMAEYDITQEELDMFLWARHAPERNAQIAKINPEMPDGGSGMTTAQAKQVLAKAKATGKLDQMVELANYIYAMQKRKQELLGQHLVEQDQLNAWNENYKYYVPLKGRALDESNVSYPRIGKGFDIRGKETLRALGRRTQPESPILHSIIDTTEAVIRARKNEVGLTFLNLVEQYPNPDYWEVFTSESPELEPRLFKTAGGETVGQGPVIDRSKYFSVKRDGKEHFIKINDELLMKAMKNMGPEPMNNLTQWAASISRFLSSVNTSFNPEFVVTNAARDIQTAVVNVLAEQDLHNGRARGKEIAAKMVKSAPKAAYAIRMSLAGKQLKGDAGEWQKMFDQFRNDGAKTGWFDAKDLEGQKKELQKMLDLSQNNLTGKVLRTRKAVAEFVENTNSAVENAVRLSVYKHALDAGVSRKKATELAKNLTVNFNRKGEIGQTMNALYMFFNASVQGTMTFARAIGTLKEVDGKKRLNAAQKVGLAAAAGAYGLAVLNRQMAGEDDDGENWYDKVPDWVKERNIVIMKSMVGGEPGEYWKIPLPYGYNIFHVFGTQAEAVTLGTTGVGEGAISVAKAAVDSFVPLSMATSDETGPMIARSITPTVGKPFIDLAYNENFWGGPIYRDNMDFAVPKADAHLYKRSTPEIWKGMAQFMNSATGGGTHISGWADVNPDSLDYLFKYFTGGAGAFASRVQNAATKAALGVELDDREIPFLRQVSGKVAHWDDVSSFYDRKEEAERLEAEWKTLNGKDRISFYKEHGAKIRLQTMADGVAKELSSLRKQRDRIEASELSAREKDQRLKKIEERMKRAVDRLNRAWPDD